MDRGAALLIALILTVACAAIGLGLLSIATEDQLLSANQRTGLEALYAADALAVRARADLAALPDWTTLPGGVGQSAFADTTLTPAAPWGGVFDLAAATAALQHDTVSSSLAGANTPIWRLFASGTLGQLSAVDLGGRDLYLSAWIADDGAEQDGEPAVDTNGVVLLRVQASGGGGLRRAVQLTLARQPPAAGEAQPTRVLAWREVR
jgi:hypothetical protein